MTDRDTFAAAALTGLLGGRPEPYTDEYAGAFAKAAWLLADAMLAARGDALRPADAAYTDGLSAATESKPTLTDEEREAVERAIGWILDTGSSFIMPVAATLRALLARLGGGQ
jgi:hypothetical protein